MEKGRFEMLVEKAFDELPQEFKLKIENVHVVVEDLPDEADLSSSRAKNKYSLLGLYSGIPLKQRGVDYGVYPVVPDRIKLFKENIERISKNDEEIEAKVREVLIQEIRKAGY